jgi:beta-phosphoglucomutase-like phosphatase (HAD superfamily)
MPEQPALAHQCDVRRVTTILCDGDDTLFPSEQAAYDASAHVTQDFARHFGMLGDFSPEHLRRTGVGRNFRSLAGDLLAADEVEIRPQELNQWVNRERTEVTAHLARTLTPVPEVSDATRSLARNYRLAVVTSSASTRLDACLAASALDELFSPRVRFSAEDSLDEPRSKPDPAIYLHAMQALGLRANECAAIEDSPTGASAAVAAGILTIGLVAFVDADLRAARVSELYKAGAAAVVHSWAAVTELFDRHQTPAATGRVER